MGRILAGAVVLGSIMSGAMAVADDEPDQRAKILGRLKELENISLRYRRGDRFYPLADSPKVRSLPSGGKLALRAETGEERRRER